MFLAISIDDDWNIFEEKNVEKISSERLLTMISQLAPSYRLIFNLYSLEGYSHKENCRKIIYFKGNFLNLIYLEQEKKTKKNGGEHLQKKFKICVIQKIERKEKVVDLLPGKGNFARGTLFRGGKKLFGVFMGENFLGSQKGGFYLFF